MLKKFLILLLVAFVIIQFFRPEKNLATTDQPAPNDISAKLAMPIDVKKILDVSCNDCHSNNTFYPWYFNIQPVAWWLDHHIREGKNELNFNEFLTYPLRKQFHKMEEIEKEVKENKMPLKSYTIIHRNAKLSPRQKQILIEWSKNVREKMKATYPADSLTRKDLIVRFALGRGIRWLRAIRCLATAFSSTFLLKKDDTIVQDMPIDEVNA